jgi:tRNA(fMet)-specific endonuclease VapC
MTLMLDTNILIHLIRNSAIATKIQEKFDLNSNSITVIYSEVSIGEIYYIANQNKWGSKKRQAFESFRKLFIPMSISYESIFEAYANIDAYSQCRHPSIENPVGMSARNMGKNDLWIAATAYVTEAVLVTTDGDFEHLNSTFIPIERIIS